MNANLKYLGLVLGLVVLAILVLRNPQQDAVRWTRQTFELLVSGRSSAQARIAWERLSAVGVDVGATYAKLPNAREQAGYRQAFLRELASGFRRSGARAESFVNWRIEESAESAEMKAQSAQNKSAEGAERDARTMVVAADFPAKQKTLLMTLTVGKPRQVTGIGWKNAESADEERRERR